jgi:antitoxin (DNA-binding transcriptional repressor) of toxin-antitoxin stability system
MPTVSATELARNAREILDMVASGGKVVTVERNRSVVARITPPERIVTAAQALAALRPAMTLEQAAAWLKESRETFDEAVRDPWE